MRYFITLLLCSGIWLTAYSQNELSGRVLDSLSREPVPFANVFFANTTIGVMSDEKGEFTLKNFRSGKYDLIVSFVGYRSFEKAVTFSESTETLTVLLKPQATQLNEVVISPNFTQRAADFRKFEKFFIGENRNASACRIMNEKEVYAYPDEDANTFIAFARAPIKIRNNALGYMLIYDLENFEINFNTLAQNYSGTPRFEELEPKNRAQKTRWEQERKRAYLGSFTHLIHCLRNRKISNPFVVHELHQKPNLARPSDNFLKERVAFWRAKFLSKRGTVYNSRIAQDSMQYYVDLYNQPVLIDSLGKKITPAQLLDETREHIIYSGLLRIVYTGEPEEPEYIKINQGKNHGQEQHSTVLIKPGGIAIYDNGYYEPIGSVFFDGYMMWSDRISNLLPREYVPEP